MKSFLLTLAVLCTAIIFSAGCETSTEYGECIGVNDKPQANLEYRYSVRNIVLGSIFIEMIFPPLLVVLCELQCPVANKGLHPASNSVTP